MTDQPTSSLSQIATEYFSTLNPIAAKIQLDIDEIANAYEHLWRTFSRREQCDVINEQLIKPDIVLRYFDAIFGGTGAAAAAAADRRTGSRRSSSTTTTTTTTTIDMHATTAAAAAAAATAAYAFNGKHLRTYALQKCADKNGQDDVCGIYRDEHSPPFCVKTKSQIDFNAFDYGDPVDDMVGGLLCPAPMPPPLPPLPPVKCAIKTAKRKARTAAAAIVRTPPNVVNAATTAIVSHADKAELPLLMFNVGNSGGSSSSGVTTGATTTVKSTGSGNAFLMKLTSSMTGGGRNSNGNNNGSTAVGDDEETLVANISLGMHSSSSGGGGPSGEEDDDTNSPQFGEFSSLLAKNNEITKKGYDFLNNW